MRVSSLHIFVAAAGLLAGVFGAPAASADINRECTRSIAEARRAERGCDGAVVARGRSGYNGPIEERGRSGYNGPIEERGRSGYNGPIEERGRSGWC